MAYLIYGPGIGFRGKYGAAIPSYDESVGRPPFVNQSQFIRKTEATYFTPMPVGGEGKRDASFAITEAADVTAIAVQNIVSSSFTINEVIDTALITANAVINGLFGITEQLDILTSIIQVVVSAIITETETTDIAAFTATAGVARNAQFAITENPDRAAFTVNLFKSYYGERPLWIIYPQLKPLLFERAVDIQASENPDTFEMEMLVTLLSRLQTSEERDTISMVVDGMHKERYANDEMSLFMMAA